jgi:hypothetical protein
MAFNEILNHGGGLPAFGEEPSLALVSRQPINPVEDLPGATEKEGRILVLTAAIITGLR